MRLNIQTDYALRLLMHLATRKPDEICKIETISTFYNISKNHLLKVAQSLNHLGVINTIRGRSGGIRLAKPANKIIVGDIVRYMENDLAIVECFPNGAGGCQITPACQLKNVLKEALDSFLYILDQYSIHDLVSSNKKLSKMLLQVVN